MDTYYYVLLDRCSGILFHTEGIRVSAYLNPNIEQDSMRPCGSVSLLAIISVGSRNGD